MAQNDKVYLLKRVVVDVKGRWDHDELLGIYSNAQEAIGKLPKPNYTQFVTSYDVDGGPDSERLVHNMLPEVELHFEPKRSEGEQFTNGTFAHFYREAKRIGINETSEELAKQIKRFRAEIKATTLRLRALPHDPAVMRETVYERAFIVGLTEILVSRSTTVKDLR
jgi:hypothetical protein